MAEYVREFEAVRFEKGRPVELKRGGYSTEKIRHLWCVCDVCGEGTWVAESSLNATWTCPTCHRKSTRKGTGEAPICKGRTVRGSKQLHEPVEMVSDDPVPGRKCRMTPRCPGRHRPISTPVMEGG